VRLLLPDVQDAPDHEILWQALHKPQVAAAHFLPHITQPVAVLKAIVFNCCYVTRRMLLTMKYFGKCYPKLKWLQHTSFHTSCNPWPSQQQLRALAVA
jgi:hypothetical protein